jgi:heme exporter protein D
MQWNSFSDFLAMGGYGLYVWSSFGLCALLMVIEPLWLRARHQQVKSRLHTPLES